MDGWEHNVGGSNFLKNKCVRVSGKRGLVGVGGNDLGGRRMGENESG